MIEVALIIGGLVLLYVGLYSLNRNTEAPAKIDFDRIKCGACSNYGCSVKQNVAEEK